MKIVTFRPLESMELMRRHDLTLAERGLWLSCLLLLAEYPTPQDPSESEPFSVAQLAKIIGSKPSTIEAGLDKLMRVGILAHTDRDTLFNFAGVAAFAGPTDIK